jgi:hypothetical protein
MAERVVMQGNPGEEGGQNVLRMSDGVQILVDADEKAAGLDTGAYHAGMTCAADGTVYVSSTGPQVKIVRGLDRHTGNVIIGHHIKVLNWRFRS